MRWRTHHMAQERRAEPRQNPKIMPKPAKATPRPMWALLKYAVTAIPQLRGQFRTARQRHAEPGRVEAMRRQAGMTVWDAVRCFAAYRKIIGRMRLDRDPAAHEATGGLSGLSGRNIPARALAKDVTAGRVRCDR